MKNRHLFPICLIVCAACGSPQTPTEPTEIAVNLTDAKEVDIDTARLVPLETSDSSLIYDICSLHRHGDRLLIHSRTYLRAYDAHSGKFLGNIARSGTGEGEFNMIGNVWMHGDTLSLFDINRQAVLSYSPDGHFLGKSTPIRPEQLHPGESPRAYYPMPSGALTVNSFSGGSTRTNPTMTFYDTLTGHSTPLQGRQVREGAFAMDGVLTNGGHEALYWEPMRDTIFTADVERGIRPLYRVNFGENSFPPELQALQSDHRGTPVPLSAMSGDRQVIARISATGCRPCIDALTGSLKEFADSNPGWTVNLLIKGIPLRDLFVLGKEYGPQFRLLAMDRLPIDFDDASTPFVFRLNDNTVTHHFTCRFGDGERTAEYINHQLPAS